MPENELRELLQIHHLAGREDDSDPRGTLLVCRACNQLADRALKAAGIGTRTRQFNPADVPDESLIQRARAAAGGGRIHGVEQLIGAYRMYAAVLQRKPEDDDAQRKFHQTEAKLRAGLGGPERQFNPADGARSLGAWLSAIMTLKGESDVMPVAAAVQIVRATPPARRSEFAQQIWERRRARYGPTGRSAVPF